MADATTTTKRNRATARNAVLTALRAAYPDAVGPDTLHAIAGRPYPSRIGEPREAGWRIETGSEPIPSYRLLSLVKGAPDPIHWGLRARLGPTSGLKVEPYGTCKVSLPEEVEARLLTDVESLVRAAFKEAGMQVPGGVQILNDEPEESNWLDVLAAYQDDGDDDGGQR